MKYLLLFLPIFGYGQITDDLNYKGTLKRSATLDLKVEHSPPPFDTTMDNRIMQQTGAHTVRRPLYRLNSTGANSAAIGFKKLENKTTGISTQTIEQINLNFTR